MLSPSDYELLVQETYEGILRDGDCAIDVGAHVGRHCIPMARCIFPTGRIHAIEPLPACHSDILPRSANLHGVLAQCLTVHPFALGDQTGESDFVVACDALGYSGLRERSYPWRTRRKRIVVPVYRLDDLFLDLPSLKYIKIDAEGAEYHILKGGRSCLEKFRPIISFEFGADAFSYYGIRAENMAQLLSEQYYVIYGIDGVLYEMAEFVHSAHAQRIWDYVAIPAEAVAMQKAIVEILMRPRAQPSIASFLRAAQDHVAVGMALPALDRFRGVAHVLAQQVARLVLFLSNVVTASQRRYNGALLEAAHLMLNRLRELELTVAAHEQRNADLTRTIDDLRKILDSYTVGDQHFLLDATSEPNGSPDILRKQDRQLSRAG
jgi:FkbM family methyltransferase